MWFDHVVEPPDEDDWCCNKDTSVLPVCAKGRSIDEISPTPLELPSARCTAVITLSLVFDYLVENVEQN